MPVSTTSELEERVSSLQHSNATLSNQLDELKKFFENRPATLEVLACMEREAGRDGRLMFKFQ